MQCVENCSDPDESKHVEFSQPVWQVSSFIFLFHFSMNPKHIFLILLLFSTQTAQMFFGECLCLLPVLIRLIYQSYFKSNSSSSSIIKPKLKSRDTNQSLDSEPLLSKTTTDDQEIPIRSSQDQSSGTGISDSSPTTKHHHQQNTKSSVGGEQARGRSRVKRQKSSSRIKKSKNLTGKAIFLFFTPAFCDICGTTLMNVGLLFTPVSIYQ